MANGQAGGGLNRREFMGSSAAVLGAMSLGAGVFSGAALGQEGGPWLDFNGLYDTKLRVRFVICGLIHETAHEGPCRIGQMDQLTEAADLRSHAATFEQRKEQIASRQWPVEVEVVDVVDFKVQVKEKDSDFRFSEGEYGKVGKGIRDIDLLVTLDGFNGLVGMQLADRFSKPIATISYSNPERVGRYGRDWGAWLVDMTAGLRHKGQEGYLAYDWEDLDRILRLLWVRKGIASSSMLVMTDRYGKTPWGMGSVFYHFDELKTMYGLGHERVSNAKVVDRMVALKKDAGARKQNEALTAALVAGAGAVHMKKEYVASSVFFYQAVRSVMAEKGCNCFGAACREICPQELAQTHKFTPCLTHTLLKDSGYCSVCQLDFNALMAMMAFSYLARKSTYMGNPEFYREASGGKNLVSVWHSVPGMKMKGFGAKSGPYEIRNFTSAGWGPTLKYDFGRDKGEVVTMGRFDPSYTKMLLTRGTIHDGYGMNMAGCTLGVNVQVEDAEEVFRVQQEFGSHLVMVYGDYVGDMVRLGEMMKFETVRVGC